MFSFLFTFINLIMSKIILYDNSQIPHFINGRERTDRMSATTCMEQVS